jgi:predicted nucleic acid-binding protein
MTDPKKTLILDANILVAHFDQQDQFHSLVEKFYQSINRDQTEIFIPDYIVFETITVMARKYEERKKSKHFPRFLQSFLNHKTPSLLTETEKIATYLPDIYKLLIKYKGLLNFNDCFLLATMKAHGINTIATFDKDFRKVKGIRVLP